LLTTGGGARLWSVGDWTEGPKLPPTALLGAFSSSGDILALEDVPGVVRLFNPATGKELAQLTAPEATRITPSYFTRDGSRLIGYASEDETLVVFNLGLLRQQLAELEIGWDGPSCSTGDGPLPPALTVQFITSK
jgi:hypothetical protein